MHCYDFRLVSYIVKVTFIAFVLWQSHKMQKVHSNYITPYLSSLHLTPITHPQTSPFPTHISCFGFYFLAVCLLRHIEFNQYHLCDPEYRAIHGSLVDSSLGTKLKTMTCLCHEPKGNLGPGRLLTPRLIVDRPVLCRPTIGSHSYC